MRAEPWRLRRRRYSRRTSGCGTNRTSSDVRLESAFRGKADYMCSQRVFRLLTQCGSRDLRRWGPPQAHPCHLRMQNDAAGRLGRADRLNLFDVSRQIRGFNSLTAREKQPPMRGRDSPPPARTNSPTPFERQPFGVVLHHVRHRLLPAPAGMRDLRSARLQHRR